MADWLPFDVFSSDHEIFADKLRQVKCHPIHELLDSLLPHLKPSAVASFAAPRLADYLAQPAGVQGREAYTFRNFAKCFSDAVNAYRQANGIASPPLVEMRDFPGPSSERSTPEHRPHTCLQLASSRTTQSGTENVEDDFWGDVAAVFEYNEGEGRANHVDVGH